MSGQRRSGGWKEPLLDFDLDQSTLETTHGKAFVWNISTNTTHHPQSYPQLPGCNYHCGNKAMQDCGTTQYAALDQLLLLTHGHWENFWSAVALTVPQDLYTEEVYGQERCKEASQLHWVTHMWEGHQNGSVHMNSSWHVLLEEIQSAWVVGFLKVEHSFTSVWEEHLLSKEWQLELTLSFSSFSGTPGFSTPILATE